MVDPERGPTVTDEAILAVFAAFEADQLRPRQVADELPIDEDRLRDRLDELHERDLLRRVDEDLPGDRWQLSAEGADSAEMPERDVETELEAQATKITDAGTAPRAEETPESPPPDPNEDPFGSMPASPEDEIEAFARAETPETERRRREAIRQVYAYLREHDRATRETLESAVFPDASGSYERSEDWWDDLVRPGLESIPAVTYDDDRDEWQLSGATEAPTGTRG